MLNGPRPAGRASRGTQHRLRNVQVLPRCRFIDTSRVLRLAFRFWSRSISSKVPKSVRQRGHLILVSPVDRACLAHSNMHLACMLPPQPRCDRRRVCRGVWLLVVVVGRSKQISPSTTFQGHQCHTARRHDCWPGKKKEEEEKGGTKKNEGCDSLAVASSRPPELLQERTRTPCAPLMTGSADGHRHRLITLQYVSTGAGSVLPSSPSLHRRQLGPPSIEEASVTKHRSASGKPGHLKQSTALFMGG